jgi:hypothetical protein
MNYGLYDFAWIRGTTTPLLVGFNLNGSPMPFDDARLSVYDRAGETLLFRLSLSNNPGFGPGTASIDGAGVITFHPTAQQTRDLIASRIGTPPGNGRNRYEIEIRQGAEESVFIMGNIAAIGGINDDE